MPHDPPARLWPYLIAYAGVAVWIDFAAVHRMHLADTLIFSLASLYEWRPFFWEQDRVGMLWPLLFSWCRHPLGNLLLQTGTTTYLGLCLPVLFTRVITPHRAGPLVATCFSAGVLAFGSPGVQLNWLLACYYPSSLALALAAVLLSDRRGGTSLTTLGRSVVAWTLLLAAHWLYLGVIVYLAPLLVFRAWATAPAGESMWRLLTHPLRNPHSRIALGGAVLAFLAVFALMRWTQNHDPSVSVTPTLQLPLVSWPDVYAGLFREAAVQCGVPLVAAVAVLAVVGVIARAFGKRAESPVASWPVVMAAAVEFVFLGSRYWVWENKCSPRYLVAGLLAVACAALSVGWVPVLARLSSRWWAGVIAVVLLFVGATVQFGWPGWDVPGREVAAASHDFGDELLAARVDGVGGEYWRVWPAVYQLNLVHADRGETEVAWGLTYRSGPWVHRWADQCDRIFRVGVISDGSPEDAAKAVIEADNYAAAYGLRRVSDEPVQVVGRVAVHEYRTISP